MRNEVNDVLKYLTRQKGMNQTDVAKELGISRAQISKWKKEGHVPFGRVEELLRLAELPETISLSWAVFVRTEERANSWYQYFHDLIASDDEWGYSLLRYAQDESEIAVPNLLFRVEELAIELPEDPPEQEESEETLRVFRDNDSVEDSQADEERWLDRDDPPFTTLLRQIVESWGQYQQWYDETLRFDDVSDDADLDLHEPLIEIEYGLMDLAIARLSPEAVASAGGDPKRLDEFEQAVLKSLIKNLDRVCETRLQHGFPVSEDYYELLRLPPEDLAEASWFRPGSRAFSGRDPRTFAENRHTIHRYFSYPERLLLQHIEVLHEQIYALSQKIEKLTDHQQAE